MVYEESSFFFLRVWIRLHRFWARLYLVRPIFIGFACYNDLENTGTAIGLRK